MPYLTFDTAQGVNVKEEYSSIIHKYSHFVNIVMLE